MTEKMHPDDIGEGLEQTAKQLRAGMVPLMGASALADLLDQARDYMDCPEPSVQPPTREQIAEVLWAEAAEDGDDPRWTWAYLSARADRSEGDYAEIRAEYYRSADAVLALFQQPTPSAEPPSIVKGMRVRYLDGGDERIVGEFVDGAWDLLIPGTEKSRMCVEPDVFWQTVEPVAVEPVSIADTAPGTMFRAQAYAQAFQMWRVVNATTVEHQSGFRHHVSVIDPSTIRDVTPPPATPEEGR